MSAGEVHTLAHRTRKAGVQVAQDLSSREVSSVQSLRDAWTYQTGYTPRGCCGPTTGGTFIPGGTQLGEHKGGRGLTSQNQEGRGQVHLNAIPSPCSFQELDSPRCCRYCTVRSWPFRGEFAFLDWSTSTCRAGHEAQE